MKKLVLAAALLIAPCILAESAGFGGSDWPRFLGPGGDGKSAEKIAKNWPAKGLAVVWFTALGEGYSAPSVAGGRLFVFDRVGDRARLSTFDAKTGEEQWQASYETAYEDLYNYSNGPRASPVIDDDMVYVLGAEGRLRAHAVKDGELRWELDTSARFGVVQNFFGAGSTPLVEGDLLIVPVGGSPPESPAISSGEVRGDGSGIVAFDKKTGEIRYQFSDELASYSSPMIATIGGKRWGFQFARGGLLAFDPTRGKERFFFPWRAKLLESVNAANPVVVEDTVFITETYGPGSALLRVRPEADPQFEVVWKDPRRGQSMQSHWSTPIYQAGYLYGSSGRSTGDAELRAIEHATGKVAWSEPGLGRSTLLYADGHFLVLTEHGRLLMVEANPERFVRVAEMDLGDRRTSEDSDAKTAVETSQRASGPKLRYPVWNAPILAHGLLYLRGKDQIVCLDISRKD